VAKNKSHLYQHEIESCGMLHNGLVRNLGVKVL